MKSVSSPRKKIALIVVIAVAAIVVVSMFPYKHFLAPEPSITFKTDSSTISIVGDFNSTYNGSGKCVILNSTEVSTTIYDNGYNTSYLNFTLGGGMIWLPIEGIECADLTPIITGHVAPNIEPENITLTMTVTGPQSPYCLCVPSLHPSPSKNQEILINTSLAHNLPATGPNDDRTYRLSIGLLNETKWSLFNGYAKGFYNFELGNSLMFWDANLGGTHYFKFSVSLPGLGETPYANITVKMVYERS